MRRCGDEEMRRCGDVEMRRCENVKIVVRSNMLMLFIEKTINFRIKLQCDNN